MFTDLWECLDKGFSGLWWILLYKLDVVFNWYFNTLIYNNKKFNEFNIELTLVPNKI